MAFAILRTAKLKTGGNIAGSLQHAFRERPTANADPAVLNVILKGDKSVNEVNQAIQERTPEKYRKDAVRVIEFMITASPEAFARHGTGGTLEDQTQYFADAVKWLEDKFGADNVVSAQIHLDETSPHLSAYVVPNVNGKLNAKEYLGGRQKLSAMQTEFAEKVGKPYGLDRGLPGSNAYHNEVKQFYAALKDKPDPMPTPPVKPRKPEEPRRPEGYLMDKALAAVGLGKSESLKRYERQQQKHVLDMKRFNQEVKRYQDEFKKYNLAVSKDIAAAKAAASVKDFLTGRYKSAVKAIEDRTNKLLGREKSVEQREIRLLREAGKENKVVIENQDLRRKLEVKDMTIERLENERNRALDLVDAYQSDARRNRGNDYVHE